MLFQAQHDLNLDLSRTYFVGDDDRDAEAADRAGCLFAKVSPDRALQTWVEELLDVQQTEETEKYGKTSSDHRA
jgi:D-glycero-D-manno-heptose 1,7-bisphosphate phosphatase